MDGTHSSFEDDHHKHRNGAHHLRSPKGLGMSIVNSVFMDTGSRAAAKGLAPSLGTRGEDLDLLNDRTALGSRASQNHKHKCRTGNGCALDIW